MPPFLEPCLGPIDVIVGVDGAGGGPLLGTATPQPLIVSAVGVPTSSSNVRLPSTTATEVGAKVMSIVQVAPIAKGSVVADEQVPPVQRNAGSVVATPAMCQGAALVFSMVTVLVEVVPTGWAPKSTELAGSARTARGRALPTSCVK